MAYIEYIAYIGGDFSEVSFRGVSADVSHP